MADAGSETKDPALTAPGREQARIVAGRIALKGDRSLRQHVAGGVAVNAAFQMMIATIGVLKGVVVAAFLTSEQYGIWGILLVTLLTLTWLRQAGIGDKFVQQDEESQELAFRKALTLELAFSSGLGVLFAAVAPLLAVVYGQPTLVAPALVLALTIPLSALQVPTWVFYRRMELVKQRLLQGLDPVVGLVVTSALAIAGAGYWSFVVGALAGVLVAGVASVAASPYRLGLAWERGTARAYLAFSTPIVIAGASSLVIAQGSIIAGEAELGLTGAGIITFAASLAHYSDRIDAIVTATLYPAICAVKDRSELLFETFVKSNRVALMWGVPFGLGLTLFAADLIQFVIGHKWSSGLTVFQVFGVTAALGHVGFNWDAFYRARDDTKPIAIWSGLTMLSFVLVPLPLLLWEGLTGYAIGMIAMTAVSLSIRSFYLVRLFAGFRMAGYAVRAVGPSLPAVGAVLLVRFAENGAERSLALASGELALYVAVTLGATWWLERDLLKELASYVRRRPRPQAGAALERG